MALSMDIRKRELPQTIKARDGQNVALFKLADSAAQLRTVGTCAAGRFPKHFLGSGGAQLLHLRIDALAICRNSSVAVNHALLMYVTSAREKTFCINGLGLSNNLKVTEGRRAISRVSSTFSRTALRATVLRDYQIECKMACAPDIAKRHKLWDS